MLVYIRLHERNVIAVDVPAMSQGQARHEFVRFGNFLERLGNLPIFSDWQK